MIMEERVSHPFQPVIDASCTTLILGSFPSVRSRETAFFYGHPRNRFWPVMAAVLGEEPSSFADVPSKKAMLLRHHIALWDVCASCVVDGSSDSSIRSAVPCDVPLLLRTAPVVRVFTNGQTADRLYRRLLLPVTGLPAVCLPSTSPANARMTTEELIRLWSVVPEGE